MLGALMSGNSLILTIFNSDTLLAIASLSCACIILAAALRIVMPRYLLTKGSPQFLIVAISGVVGCAAGSFLGHPGVAWVSLLLAFRRRCLSRWREVRGISDAWGRGASRAASPHIPCPLDGIRRHSLSYRGGWCPGPVLLNPVQFVRTRANTAPPMPRKVEVLRLLRKALPGSIKLSAPGRRLVGSPPCGPRSHRFGLEFVAGHFILSWLRAERVEFPSLPGGGAGWRLNGRRFWDIGFRHRVCRIGIRGCSGRERWGWPRRETLPM